MTAQIVLASKTCSKCGIEKTGAEFNGEARRPDGLTTHCKACIAAYVASRRTRKGILAPPPDPCSADPYSVLFVLFRMVAGFPGYGVDTDGDVWTCRQSNGLYAPIWRKLSPSKVRYHLVKLHRGDKSFRSVSIHTVVLETFVGPCPSGMEGCHNDGDKANNRLRNLRWDFPFANSNDKRIHGTMARGSRQGLARLTEEGVALVRRLRSQGESFASLGRRFGVRPHTIRQAVVGATWKHVPAEGATS